MARTNRLSWGLIISMGVFVSSLAHGDVIKLRHGGEIEGKIVKEDPKEVSLETPFGVQRIERTKILSIVRKEAPQDEIARRRAELAADDAQGRFELALFAEEKKFKKIYRALLRETVEIDPNHERAQKALGRVLYRGKWVLPKEKEKLEASDQEAEMRAKGLVPYKGRWVTELEKEKLEKGLILHEGQWLTEEAYKRAIGLEKYGDQWVPTLDVPFHVERARLSAVVGLPLAMATSAHLAIVTDLGEAEAEETVKLAQAGTERFLAEFGIPPSDLEWLGGKKALLVMLSEKASYHKMIEDVRTKTRVDKTWVDITKNTFGFYLWDRSSISVAYQGGRRKGAVRGQTLHQLGHLLINRLHYDYKVLPPWLDEGFASLFEWEAHGRNDVYCVGRHGYLSGGKAAFARVRGDWIDKLSELLRTSSDTKLPTLITRELNELLEPDIAKAMGVLYYVRSTSKEHWPPWFRALRQKWPSGAKPASSPCVDAHHQTIHHHFECELRDLDERARQWLLQQAGG